jgi:hypothetical protein
MTMKKKFILFVIFIIGNFILFGKIIPLPDLLKPISIQIDNSQIYITEGTSIYIYSLDDFKLVKKFGKEGEGPQEFKILPQLPLIINVSTNRIMVNSLGKVSYFTKNGDFIGEEKVKAGFVFNLLPLGKYLAGQGLTQEDNIRYRAINIYDREMNKIKEVCKAEDNFQGPGQGFKVVHTAFGHQTMGNLLFVAQSKEFLINVYDQNGKELSSITMDYELVNMTQKDRDDIKNYIETDASIKQFSEILKPIRYPDEFPAIFTMFSTEEKLYVMTWKRVNQQNEFFVFDTDGNLIKKSFLPLAYQNAILPSPFAIKNNKFYQLVENEENEEWELHINEIK